MGWIELPGTPWDDAWVRRDVAGQFDVFSGDGLGVQWLHLETGSRIALVGDGGWEMMKYNEPYQSRFRIIRLDPANGHLMELTTELLGGPFAAAFNPQFQGTFRYSWIYEKCAEMMRRLLEQPVDIVNIREFYFRRP